MLKTLYPRYVVEGRHCVLTKHSGTSFLTQVVFPEHFVYYLQCIVCKGINSTNSSKIHFKLAFARDPVCAKLKKKQK